MFFMFLFLAPPNRSRVKKGLDRLRKHSSEYIGLFIPSGTLPHHQPWPLERILLARTMRSCPPSCRTLDPQGMLLLNLPMRRGGRDAEPATRDQSLVGARLCNYRQAEQDGQDAGLPWHDVPAHPVVLHEARAGNVRADRAQVSRESSNAGQVGRFAPPVRTLVSSAPSDRQQLSKSCNYSFARLLSVESSCLMWGGGALNS
jgi:hypothetical protein